jgi:hypothetical protein
MKDSPKEKALQIRSLYLAINEGPPGKILSLYLAINEGLPEGEGREDIVPLPAINEILPEGERMEEIVPLPGHK